MKPARPEVPRLLLGVTSLGQPVRATRDRQLEVASRFKESESLAVALVKAVHVGAEALVVSPTHDVRDALAELDKDLPLLVRAPHTPIGDDLRWEPALLVAPGEEHNRDAWNNKTPAAAAMNLLPMSLAADLGSRVVPRLERELAGFSAKSLRGFVVPAPLTDLAMASGQSRFFERMLRFAAGRQWIVGLETRNMGHLLQRLVPWGITPDFVMGPVNPRGVGMLPDAAGVFEQMAAGKVKVVATELRAGGLVPLEEGVAYARAKGVWGVCPELVELDDVPKELKALAGPKAA